MAFSSASRRFTEIASIAKDQGKLAADGDSGADGGVEVARLKSRNSSVIESLRSIEEQVEPSAASLRSPRGFRDAAERLEAEGA